MASAVYSEPPASRLSISLEGEASASPFPSPSSSFLPPPTPGAHEFAVKPAPAARNGRKLSSPTTAATAITNGDTTIAATPTSPRPGSEPNSQRSSAGSLQGPALAVNGLPQPPVVSPSPSLSPSPPSSGGASTTILTTTKERPSSETGMLPASPSLLSPITPTPYTMQHQASGSSSSTLEPPRSPGVEGSTSSSTTPTIQTLALPPEDTPMSAAADSLLPQTTIPTTPTTATTKARIRQEDEYLAKIVIPNNLDAGLTSVNGASSPSSPAFSTFSNTSNRSRSRPLSTSFAPDPTSSTSASSPSLFSNRPAPPSPALSRRVSGVPSLSSTSTRSKSSRPPSQVLSRANSSRKSTSGAGASPMMHPHRLSQSFAPSPLPSPASPAFAMNVSGPPLSELPAQQQQQQPEASTSTSAATVAASAAQTARIQVRDFGFPGSDERHCGLGPDVPRANKVARLNRRLGAARTHSMGGASVASSDDGDEEEDQEGEWEDDADGGWGSSSVFGTLRWTGGAGYDAGAGAGAGAEGSGFPSRSDLDMNFRSDAAPDEEWDTANGGGVGADADEQEYEEEDTLYPGLYRALYAFEPEGTAEMRLVEDQVVRVVGRGGGVGWAVVVDESLGAGGEGEGGAGEALVRHALVPESYLEPVKLDWEDEEAAVVGGAVEAPQA